MRVCVVTGSNVGIGFGMVKSLCKKFKGDVFMTALTEEDGLIAQEKLAMEGLKGSKLSVLDIRDESSIVSLRNLLSEKYGGLDVLINNAGVAFKPEDKHSFGEKATVTLETNYWGNKRCCEILFPILRPGSRVVNMSSSCGFLGHIDRTNKSEEAAYLKARLSAEDLTIPELDEMMLEFERLAQTGNHRKVGWPDSTYVVSKIGLSALTRIQQRMFDSDEREDIVVNHVHPGYVPTFLTGYKGNMTIEQGAAPGVFAALLPPHTLIKGKYIWKDFSIVDWAKGPAPNSSSVSGKLVMP